MGGEKNQNKSNENFNVYLFKRLQQRNFYCWLRNSQTIWILIRKISRKREEEIRKTKEQINLKGKIQRITPRYWKYSEMWK